MSAKASKAEPDEEAALGYRPCVGIMLLNRANEVFVGQRLGAKNLAWQMPQGGIDEGETPEQAALRELEEEVGTAKAEILATSADWLNYEVPAKKRPKGWRGRFRGQRQKWFALRFLGADVDIDIETEHPEFSTWRWVNHKDLPTLIVPFKRAVYLQVLKEFSALFRS